MNALTKKQMLQTLILFQQLKKTPVCLLDTLLTVLALAWILTRFYKISIIPKPAIENFFKNKKDLKLQIPSEKKVSQSYFFNN